jgi:hypothetical protein
MDLRRVRLRAKTIRVPTAHDIAAAKVRVAQKPGQLRPDREERAGRREKHGNRSTRTHAENVNRHKEQAREERKL